MLRAVNKYTLVNQSRVCFVVRKIFLVKQLRAWLIMNAQCMGSNNHFKYIINLNVWNQKELSWSWGFKFQGIKFDLITRFISKIVQNLFFQISSANTFRYQSDFFSTSLVYTNFFEVMNDNTLLDSAPFGWMFRPEMVTEGGDHFRKMRELVARICRL